QRRLCMSWQPNVGLAKLPDKGVIDRLLAFAQRAWRDTFFVFPPKGTLAPMNSQDLDMTRRSILKTAAAAGAVGAVPGLQSAVWAAGSDKPELEEVKIGF